MKQPNTIYTAALYLRLSKDDGLMDKDSASKKSSRIINIRLLKKPRIFTYNVF